MNAKMILAEWLRDGARSEVDLTEKTKQAMLDAADILAEIAADEEIDYVGPCRFQPEDVRLQADYVAECMDIPELTDEDVEAIWDEVRGKLKHTTDIAYGNDRIAEEIKRYFKAKEEEDADS